LTNLNLFPIQF
jgi:homeobox protein Unc-4